MHRFPLPLAFAAGLASATGFAPLNWWMVTLAAFALLVHLIAGAEKQRAALGLGYAFGVGHFIIGLNWIAGAFRYQDAMPVWLGWVAVVALSLYLAVYPAIAAGLAWRFGKERPEALVLLFAGGWVITEWLRATLFTGFAWNPLGVVLVEPGLADLSRIIGTYGLSGLAVALAGALWLFARQNWVPGAAMLAALAGALALGNQEPVAAPKRSEAPLLRIVQPNIGQQDKHNDAFDTVNFAKLAQLTGKPAREPRLILWPEAAVPEFIGEDDRDAKDARARIAGLMGPEDVLLTGAVKLHSRRVKREGWEEERVVGAGNSLFAMDASGNILSRYDKSHLVPYGEYLPMRPILSAIGLSRLVPGDLDFWPGPGPQTLTLPRFGMVGMQICYEIIFSGDVVDAANRPAFLFNPSNDAWFGSWGPPQHLAQARLRAIEEAMPVIRSTPTGISAVIAADGSVLDSLPYQQPGYIDARLPLRQPATLFSQHGNILSLALAFFLGAAGFALARIRR